MFLKKFSIFVVFVALIIISFKKGYQYYFKSLYPTSYPTSIASENIRLDGEMIVPKVFHRIWLIWDTKNPDMPEVYKDFDKILKT